MRAPTRRRWGPELTPWRELDTLSDTFGRWLDYPALGTPFGLPLSETTGWHPPVELVEEEGEFVLTVELPGVEKADMDVSVEDNVLTLKGEKKLEREEDRGKVHIRERRYGSFERSFTVPSNVDAAKIKADFRDGVMKVHMPKGEEAKSRRINIGSEVGATT